MDNHVTKPNPMQDPLDDQELTEFTAKVVELYHLMRVGAKENLALRLPDGCTLEPINNSIPRHATSLIKDGFCLRLDKLELDFSLNTNYSYYIRTEQEATRFETKLTPLKPDRFGPSQPRSLVTGGYPRLMRIHQINKTKKTITYGKWVFSYSYEVPHTERIELGAHTLPAKGIWWQYLRQRMWKIDTWLEAWRAVVDGELDGAWDAHNAKAAERQSEREVARKKELERASGLLEVDLYND